MKTNVNPPQAGAPRNPTPTQAVRSLLERFGYVVIPVDPATIVGELAGQETDLYGNRKTLILLRYVRPASVKEWKDVRTFLLTIGLPFIPPTPRGWTPWVLESAALPPDGGKTKEGAPHA